MSLLWNLELLNHNSQRNFPLASFATRVDSAGVITLPNSFLVGLEFSLHAGISTSPSKLFLHSLVISPIGYSLAIAYDDGSSSPPIVATTNFARSTHAEYDTYKLVGKNDFDDCDGHVAIGALTEIDELPAGEYFFAYAGGALDIHAVRPGIRGISSLVVVNGNDRSERIYGDVALVAGTNMRISATTGDAPTITISAISGEGLNQTCVCNELQEAPCIRTINGIPGTPDGDFRLGGTQCLTITAGSTPATLEFDNPCSVPCCGCKELDALRDQLTQLADGKAELVGLANRTHNEVATMSLVVLSSKLNDTGCDSET